MVLYCTFVVTVGPMNVYVYASSCIVVRVYKSCLCVPLYTCSTTYTYCTNKYFRTLKVLSYENTFESMTKVRAADLLEFFDPETRQFEPPKHGLNGRQ